RDPARCGEIPERIADARGSRMWNKGKFRDRSLISCSTFLYTEIMKTEPKSPAHTFYAEVLKILKDEKFTFMVAGGFAVNAYTGLRRPTKDIDIFCKAGDYPKILNKFTSLGYRTQVLDERWIAKIFKGKSYVDLIFGSSNLVAPVTG